MIVMHVYLDLVNYFLAYIVLNVRDWVESEYPSIVFGSVCCFVIMSVLNVKSNTGKKLLC